MSGQRDQLCVNTIRMLAVDMVQQAKSGHPGTPMGVNENLCVNGMIRVRCSFQETSRQTG